jgi:hypothetical protein
VEGSVSEDIIRQSKNIDIVVALSDDWIAGFASDGKFTSIAEEPDLRLDIALEVGDMQFVHNHTIFARSHCLRRLARAGTQTSFVAAVDRSRRGSAAATGISPALRQHRDW